MNNEKKSSFENLIRTDGQPAYLGTYLHTKPVNGSLFGS